MELVVFLRGANVGGQKTFRPSALAKELAALDVVSVGAAGTFVVLKAASQAQIREEFASRLPFAAETIVCPAHEVLGLAKSDPFAKLGLDDGITPYVSILARRAPTALALPLTQPDGEAWQVKVFAISGKFALSLHRRMGRTLIYPNQVVEKKFGVPATTRNWSTISAICGILTGRQ